MPNTGNFVERISKIPEVAARIGNVKFAAKSVKPQLTVAAKEEKKEAPKAVAKKDEDGAEVVKKEVNPLDALPPSKFDLFSFKTFFVNHKDRKGEGM